MGDIFNYLGKDIVEELEIVHEDLAKLLKAFKKTIGYFNEKSDYLKKFLEYEEENKKEKFPDLIKKFSYALLEELSIEKKEEAIDKRLISEVLEIIRSKTDVEDSQKIENIEAELKQFLSDLVVWKELILKQKSFLEENQDRILEEHEYIIRQLPILMEEEKQIMLKHLKIQEPSEKEIIDNVQGEIESIVEAWRPHFMEQFTLKEITDPKDPDLLYLYDEVFRICFPVDLMPFEDFQRTLGESKTGMFGKGKYHIIVMKNNAGKIVAGESFYFLVDESKKGLAFGIDEYIGVLQEYRRYYIATKIVSHRLKILNKESKEAGFDKVHAIFGEYPDEDKLTKEWLKKDDFDPVKRKKFWKEMNMKALNFDYKTPALNDKRKIEEIYTLGFWTILKEHRKRVDSQYLRKVLRRLYTGYYGINMNHRLIQEVDKVLAQRDFVQIVSLV